MLYWIFSFFIGGISVLQGGLNRKVAESWGLSGAIFINSFIILIIAGLFLSLCVIFPQLFSPLFHLKYQGIQLKWWHAIPAFCGFTIVCGIPALIPKVGASSVFLFIILGQLIFSLLWDLKVENISITPQKYLGILIAFIGFVITYWKK